ncbi:hypothetical protein D3C86_1683620 [compost metagenome]
MRSTHALEVRIERLVKQALASVRLAVVDELGLGVLELLGHAGPGIEESVGELASLGFQLGGLRLGGSGARGTASHGLGDEAEILALA